MNWQEVKAEFKYDGSLRDLYILDADMQTWQRALDWLRTSSYPLSYTIEKEQVELPADAGAIFSKRLEASPLLSVDVQGIRINSHFFIAEQIEFDIDPREVNNEAQFGHLCEFMQRLGQHLGQSVILTPETSGREEEEVILRYSPIRDQFTYTPVGLPS